MYIYVYYRYRSYLYHVLFIFRDVIFIKRVSRGIRVDYSQNLLVCRTVDSAHHLAQYVNYKKQTRHVNHRYD